MQKLKKVSTFWGSALTIVGIIVIIGTVSNKGKTSATAVPSAPDSPFTKELLAKQIGKFVRANQFPHSVDLDIDGKSHKTAVQYGIEVNPQASMEKLIHQYQPDYSAFVAMDAKTGRILSMISYSRNHPELENMALTANVPAASIFKVVTASAALDLNKASPETIVPYNGGNHTLYKKNVSDTRENRWTRHITMREAFSRSINTVFGKLGLFYVGPENLLQYAERFNFNRPIRADVPVDIGTTHIESGDAWNVVQAASGFTRDTTMSPLQGAMIAAAVANDGMMMEPYLIDTLVDESGKAIYQAEPKEVGNVIDSRSAALVRELMRATVKNGTSRKAFRQTLHKRQFEEVEFGGKTGSLTGLNPQGKCDWFIGYARYKGERIAVAALTVNEKKWRVKSSQLAKEFFTGYMKEVIARDRFTASK